MPQMNNKDAVIRACRLIESKLSGEKRSEAFAWAKHANRTKEQLEALSRRLESLPDREKPFPVPRGNPRRAVRP